MKKSFKMLFQDQKMVKNWKKINEKSQCEGKTVQKLVKN